MGSGKFFLSEDVRDDDVVWETGDDDLSIEVSLCGVRECLDATWRVDGGHRGGARARAIVVIVEPRSQRSFPRGEF